MNKQAKERTHHINIYIPSCHFTLESDDRIQITQLETKGNDLKDCLANVLLYAEDWHGNPVELSVEDLSAADYAAVERAIAEQLAGDLAQGEH